MEKRIVLPSQEIAGYVTVGKAALLLKVSERFIRRRIAEGDYQVMLVGDHQPIWLIDRDSLVAHIEQPRKHRGPQKGHGGRPKQHAASASGGAGDGD